MVACQKLFILLFGTWSPHIDLSFKKGCSPSQIPEWEFTDLRVSCQNSYHQLINFV